MPVQILEMPNRSLPSLWTKKNGHTLELTNFGDFRQNLSSKLAIDLCPWPAPGPPTAQPRPIHGPAKTHPRPSQGPPKAHPWFNHGPPRAHSQPTEGQPYDGQCLDKYWTWKTALCPPCGQKVDILWIGQILDRLWTKFIF